MEGYELYKMIRRIADIIYEFAATRIKEDLRENDVHPGHSQTKQGLLLECNWDTPQYMWTPWGSYHFVGQPMGSFSLVLQQVRTKIDLIYNPVLSLGLTNFYEVMSVEGILLPQPILRFYKEFVSQQEALDDWKVQRWTYHHHRT